MILGSACLCAPTLGLQVCNAKSGFFMWVLGIWVQILMLSNKHSYLLSHNLHQQSGCWHYTTLLPWHDTILFAKVYWLWNQSQNPFSDIHGLNILCMRPFECITEDSSKTDFFLSPLVATILVFPLLCPSRLQRSSNLLKLEMSALWLQQQRDPGSCSWGGSQVKLAEALEVTRRFFIVMVSFCVLSPSADFYLSANHLNTPSWTLNKASSGHAGH